MIKGLLAVRFTGAFRLIVTLHLNILVTVIMPVQSCLRTLPALGLVTCLIALFGSPATVPLRNYQRWYDPYVTDLGLAYDLLRDVFKPLIDLRVDHTADRGATAQLAGRRIRSVGRLCSLRSLRRSAIVVLLVLARLARSSQPVREVLVRPDKSGKGHHLGEHAPGTWQGVVRRGVVGVLSGGYWGSLGRTLLGGFRGALSNKVQRRR